MRYTGKFPRSQGRGTEGRRWFVGRLVERDPPGAREEISAKLEIAEDSFGKDKIQRNSS